MADTYHTDPAVTVRGAGVTPQSVACRALALGVAEHVYGWTWHADDDVTSDAVLPPHARAGLRSAVLRHAPAGRGPLWLLPPIVPVSQVQPNGWAWWESSVTFAHGDPPIFGDDRLVMEPALRRPDVVAADTAVLVHALRLAGCEVAPLGQPIVPYDGDYPAHRASLPWQCQLATGAHAQSRHGLSVPVVAVVTAPTFGIALCYATLLLVAELAWHSPLPLLDEHARHETDRYADRVYAPPI